MPLPRHNEKERDQQNQRCTCRWREALEDDRHQQNQHCACHCRHGRREEHRHQQNQACASYCPVPRREEYRYQQDQPCTCHCRRPRRISNPALRVSLPSRFAATLSHFAYLVGATYSFARATHALAGAADQYPPRSVRTCWRSRHCSCQKKKRIWPPALRTKTAVVKHASGRNHDSVLCARWTHTKHLSSRISTGFFAARIRNIAVNIAGHMFLRTFWTADRCLSQRNSPCSQLSCPKMIHKHVHGLYRICAFSRDPLRDMCVMPLVYSFRCRQRCALGTLFLSFLLLVAYVAAGCTRGDDFTVIHLLTFRSTATGSGDDSILTRLLASGSGATVDFLVLPLITTFRLFCQHFVHQITLTLETFCSLWYYLEASFDSAATPI